MEILGKALGIPALGKCLHRPQCLRVVLSLGHQWASLLATPWVGQIHGQPRWVTAAITVHPIPMDSILTVVLATLIAALI